MHGSFQINVFIFSGCVPRSGIAGSYGSSIFKVLFFWLSFVFLAVPTACGSSWAREPTCTTAVTQVAAVTMPDP